MSADWSLWDGKQTWHGWGKIDANDPGRVKTLEAIVGAQQKNRTRGLSESFRRGRHPVRIYRLPERPVAAAWPPAARAQQAERVRRIGIFMNLASDDAEGQSRNAAFLQGLQELGWSVGRNVRIDSRWGANNLDPDRMRKDAADLLALSPDVVVAATAPIVVVLRQVSRTVPIAFGGVIDPVGSGLVASLARPGGNATGFLMFEYGIAAKWLELLKEISPGVKRVAVLREATLAGIGQLAAMQTASPSFGVELHPIDVSDAGEIERALADFARAPNGGLIVPLSTSAISHRKLIVALAARHQLPAIYPSRLDATVGGLISYGPDGIDTYRRVAGYVDRILKGEKPADLPIQLATEFELIINLRTASNMGLAIPPALIARADEVIE